MYRLCCGLCSSVRIFQDEVGVIFCVRGVEGGGDFVVDGTTVNAETGFKFDFPKRY
jgi:hypothetical protein